MDIKIRFTSLHPNMRTKVEYVFPKESSPKILTYFKLVDEYNNVISAEEGLKDFLLDVRNYFIKLKATQQKSCVSTYRILVSSNSIKDFEMLKFVKVYKDVFLYHKDNGIWKIVDILNDGLVYFKEKDTYAIRMIKYLANYVTLTPNLSPSEIKNFKTTYKKFVGEVSIVEDTIFGQTNFDRILKQMVKTLNHLSSIVDLSKFPKLKAFSVVTEFATVGGRYYFNKCEITVNLLNLMDKCEKDKLSAVSKTILHEFGHHIFNKLKEDEQFMYQFNLLMGSAINVTLADIVSSTLTDHQKNYLLDVDEIFARLFEQSMLNKMGLQKKSNYAMWYFSEEESKAFDYLLSNYTNNIYV